MITIKKSIIKSLIEHAENELPFEACGYLGEKDGVICRLYKMKNMDKSSTHYSFDPKEQFEIIRKMRIEGIKTSAVYHSHPGTPARMSQEDIKLAYDTSVSYLIISLLNEGPVIKSFRMQGKKVQEEEIKVVDG
jgi:proteasome lid subunit RPN8/RPN11